MIKKILILMGISLMTIGCSNSKGNEGLIQAPREDAFTLSLVEDSDGIKLDEVFTFLCEVIKAKPSESTPNCADFGEAVFDITWDSWSAEGAKGRGRYSINDCDPDCASGTRHETDVKVRLDNLYTDGKRYFLRDFSFESEKAVMPGRSKTGGWDTAEFYLEVPDMRSDG